MTPGRERSNAVSLHGYWAMPFICSPPRGIRIGSLGHTSCGCQESKKVSYEEGGCNPSICHTRFVSSVHPQISSGSRGLRVRISSQDPSSYKKYYLPTQYFCPPMDTPVLPAPSPYARRLPCMYGGAVHGFHKPRAKTFPIRARPYFQSGGGRAGGRPYVRVPRCDSLQ